MKAVELGQFLLFGAMMAIVQASRRQIGQGNSWSASWSWPADQPTTTYRNEFNTESDYNQLPTTLTDYTQLPTTVTDYNSLDYNDQRYQNRVLTDEEIIDLLYSHPGRSGSATRNLDHPTFLERTTYTALYDPEVDNNRQYNVQRQQESRPHPVVTSYSHMIYH